MNQIKNKKSSSLELLINIWQLTSDRRHKQFIGIIILILISAAMEIISLTSVLPFLVILTNPEQIWKLKFIKYIAFKFGIYSANGLILPLGFFFGLAIILSAIIRLFNLWINYQFVAGIGSELSCKSYSKSLYKPYVEHLSKNSSEIISVTTNQINNTVLAISLSMQFITSIFLIIGILIGLYNINNFITIISTVCLTTIYFIISYIFKRKFEFNGNVIVRSNQEQLKCLQEGLGAIREVILDEKQNTYIDIYKKVDLPMRRRQAENQFLSFFPRYGIEALGLLFIIFLSIFLKLSEEYSTSVVPLIGTFALGAQRLLPAMQQAYSSLAGIRQRRVAMQKVLEILNENFNYPKRENFSQPKDFRSSIRLNDVCFKYNKEGPQVINDLNLTILKGERIGIIGRTGSGKSTLIDIVMGLLTPTKGEIYIDEVRLHDVANHERLFNWRSNITHVPQSIFLSDSSLAENIAFGEKQEELDYERIETSAKAAQIHQFIINLKNSYRTNIGERGVKLSGGQRQRLGIARALYKKCSVIVLDEATSALDTKTESKVIDSIKSLNKDLTIITIAHRLSTLKFCDKIIKIEKGNINNIYKPEELF